MTAAFIGRFRRAWPMLNVCWCKEDKVHRVTDEETGETHVILLYTLAFEDYKQ